MRRKKAAAPAIPIPPLPDELLQRLLDEENVDRQLARERGKSVGLHWAANEARPWQMRRLEKLDYDAPGIFDNGMNRDIAHELYKALHRGADDDTSYEAVDAFWEDITGPGGRENIDDIYFAEGFLSGVLGFWAQALKQAAGKL